jgi:uncharacterized protein (DUF1015 family)
MTTIRPFRALRYDTTRVDLSRVLAPPYDVVAADERHALYDRDPYNAVRLELTRNVADEAASDYTAIRETLAAWRAEGVLALDDAPALYGLRQPYVAPDGTKGTREGFFALLHLEDYARRIVRPHERTLAGPKADRLKVLRAARSNLSPVFLLYEDRDDSLPRHFASGFKAPIATASDEAGTSQLARVDDSAALRAVSDFLTEHPVVIADGHHRYETALAYRDACRVPDGGADRDGPHEWLLAYFANAFAPGCLLLPIHRLLLKGAPPTEAAWRERLRGWDQQGVDVPSADAIPELLAQHLEPLAGRHAFAADDASGRLRIFSRPRAPQDDLAVRVIHSEVIEGVFGLDEDAVRSGAIAYPKSAVQTARDLRAGHGSVALYLNALTAEDVFRVTEAGEVMPQKSTFFYPKLPTGLVLRLLEES